MSIYPIKMLKDEEGRPFVPLTSIKAVSGIEYVQGILEASKSDATHFIITNDDLTEEKIIDKLVVVRFGETSKTNTASYLKLNNENYYPIYNAENEVLEIGDVSKAVCLLSLKDGKWITVGSTGGGGHHITDTDGNVMTQRGVLNFVNLSVIDDAGNGATKVINNNWVKKYTGIAGSIDDAKYVPLCDPINVSEAGLYRVNIMIRLNDIKSTHREIGIGDGSSYNWDVQYKRYAGNISFIIDKEAGSTIKPVIYIDKLSSTDNIEIKYSHIYIEKLNKID